MRACGNDEYHAANGAQMNTETLLIALAIICLVAFRIVIIIQSKAIISETGTPNEKIKKALTKHNRIVATYVARATLKTSLKEASSIVGKMEREKDV